MGTISEHSFDFRTIIRMHDLKTSQMHATKNIDPYARYLH